MLRKYMAEEEAKRRRIQNTLNQVRSERNSQKHDHELSLNKKTIDDKVEDKEEARKKTLDNDAREQDIKLKKETLDGLFSFLRYESIAIFALVFLQGFSFKGFRLESWSFRLLIAATITQITIMLQIAVKHLFPRK